MRVVDVKAVGVFVAIGVLAWWLDRRLAEMERSARLRETRLLNGNVELMATIYDQTQRTADGRGAGAL